jgi:hypothetical protein
MGAGDPIGPEELIELGVFEPGELAALAVRRNRRPAVNLSADRLARFFDDKRFHKNQRWCNAWFLRDLDVVVFGGPNVEFGNSNVGFGGVKRRSRHYAVSESFPKKVFDSFPAT